VSDTSYIGPDRRHAQRSALPTWPAHEAARPSGELFDVLWRLHLEAMQSASYEAAYHILAAALHCAELGGSVARVAEVERIAIVHQQELDARRPSHPLSTAGAATRGTNPLFTSLRGTARVMRVRLHADQVLQGQRASREAADQADPGGERADR
jgi:hypothetical protein